MQTTVTFPKGKSLPKKDNKTILKSLTRLLKDYLRKVFDAHAKLYRRCIIVKKRKNKYGEDCITINLHNVASRYI